MNCYFFNIKNIRIKNAIKLRKRKKRFDYSSFDSSSFVSSFFFDFVKSILPSIPQAIPPAIPITGIMRNDPRTIGAKKLIIKTIPPAVAVPTIAPDIVANRKSKKR